ncbi:HRDC domain-containing protein [Nocardia zapadnayensis]|nr:HRDC domain-containing protein [Nocardia zapadnayensis]MCX0276666.1 HRDC domain-containing protein [Nocardia zapadnayensis]
MSSHHTDESLPLLSAPADGVPDIVDTPDALATAVRDLAAGTGAVAVDAERASGIRYGGRAFLIQLRRAGAGTILIDPEALPDLSTVDDALRGAEWVLHASTQDLPCLAERGMRPDALFDTELAARMLDFERFGLAAVVGETLGVRLAKEHSNVDWSRRPLPPDWLTYAALDVELLIEVSDILQAQLQETGKAEFAQQEFDHLLDFTPNVYAEPWRRVQGLGTVKSRRGLARVRSLWTARDRVAAAQDLAPSQILRDRHLIALVGIDARTPDDLRRVPGVPGMDRSARLRWHKALSDADALPEAELPDRRSADAEAPAEVDRNRVKARLDLMKPAVQEVARDLQMPHEVVLTPRHVKTLAVRRTIGDEQAVAAFLAERGARPWQIEATAGVLAAAAAEADRD